MILERRQFLKAMLAAAAAPMIVKAANIMPVRALERFAYDDLIVMLPVPYVLSMEAILKNLMETKERIAADVFHFSQTPDGLRLVGWS